MSFTSKHRKRIAAVRCEAAINFLKRAVDTDPDINGLWATTYRAEDNVKYLPESDRQQAKETILWAVNTLRRREMEGA